MDFAAIVRAADVLMSPLAWESEGAWLAEGLRAVREVCDDGGGGALPAEPLEALEVLLRLPGEEPGWLRAALSAGGGALPLVRAAPEALLPVVSLRCALAAGLATLHRSRAWRATLARAFDELDSGMVIFASDGRREIARNEHLELLLASEPEPARLLEHIALRAARVARGESCRREEDRELELPGGSYRLASSRAAAGMLLPGPAVLVLVDRVSAALPTTQELRVGFGLRGREPQVALLAAEGLSNAAIAERLRLSSHTVRHYLERVLFRLGLHSRTALALRLMGGGESRSAERRRRPRGP